MSTSASKAGAVAYGALFAVALPLAAAGWARATADVVPLPAPEAGVWLGPPLVLAGAALMLWAWAALWFRGGGLPMNAFPPPRRVTSGPYALVAHPIYLGFSGVALGLSLWLRSASGVWLVTPALTLGWLALLWGYEKRALEARLGPPHRTWVQLPPDEERPPTFAERLAFYPLVLLPWCTLYQACLTLGAAPDAFALSLPGEAELPVWPWTEALYFSVYPLVVAVPFGVASSATLRRLCVRALWAMALCFPLYLLVPIVAPPRPFTGGGWLGQLLALERTVDAPVAAAPSFHVLWAMLATAALASRWPRGHWARAALAAWGVAISVSCLTTGMHTLADVLLGFAALWPVARLPQLWEALRAGTERVANSFRAWEWGQVRLLGYAGYAALATGVGLWLAGTLAGPAQLPALALMGVAATVGAAAWAQWVEGASGLSRPYGFYGGLLGMVAGGLAARAVGGEPMLALAAWACAGPFTQAAGRLRCLVQGCCHGAPTTHDVGIRYVQPTSRVLRLAGLGGVPLHPTPLYSILWNLLCGALLLRLWWLGAATALVGGLFLLLNGLGRFVEEAYRGEPQTPERWGLRLYQWTALASVLAGAAVMAWGPRALAPRPVFSWNALAAGLAFGAVSAFTAGVDFPKSNRRFSRLA